MEKEKSKVLIQFFFNLQTIRDVLFFLFARRLRGYTATASVEDFAQKESSVSVFYFQMWSNHCGRKLSMLLLANPLYLSVFLATNWCDNDAIHPINRAGLCVFVKWLLFPLNHTDNTWNNRNLKRFSPKTDNNHNACRYSQQPQGLED